MCPPSEEPTISSASLAGSTDSRSSTVAVVRPLRSTVAWSQQAITSSSLWLM